uniref:Delta(3,5)-Delta(2,4)-dienoyl-CoA isomerase, mitochondrial n=1 Tax=Cacopsylla melanoneura TaxID=428564 RepID=A0A8D8SJ00_9HEMI
MNSLTSVLKSSLGSSITKQVTRTMASSFTPETYKTLLVKVPKPFVFHVELNRPDKLNAMNHTMWLEIRECFDSLAENDECRAVVLSAAGKLFTAGLDLSGMMTLGQEIAEQEDVARKSKVLRKLITTYQNSISSLEKIFFTCLLFQCPKPVIAAVHGACVGGGLNLISAADIRYATNDAWFTLKEVDIGLTADVGALQRLPRIIGSQSLVNEFAFTARKIESSEAKECGLVSKLYNDKESLVSGAIELAALIASKSPVAVQGTKRSIVFSRDHTVQEGLDQLADYNSTMMQGEDFLNAAISQATKSPPPIFSKL